MSSFPERLLHSVEVVGTAPAIRYEVTLGSSIDAGVREEAWDDPKGVGMCRSRWHRPQPARCVQRGNAAAWPYHVNVYELEKRNATKKNFTQEAIRANRARGNFICGYRPASFPTEKGDRGHRTPTRQKPGLSCSRAAVGLRRRREDVIIARQGEHHLRRARHVSLAAVLGQGRAELR